ncbi:hypothetical protein EW145_g5889 [Phellinidium pouzarii]|uniref:AAA+ ATPase domain-containing protein n=1 Tax=Phellinidium pouzarii TaxID=167371 RepID=A0A4S4KYI4_9AGAM|nr:hypothetical protein EW145_g5889 [Phellinidium pouzarii]
MGQGSSIYASLLAILSISASPQWRDVTSRKLAFLLLSEFVAYLILDVWPYATLNQAPFDSSADPITWARIALLAFGGVVILLIMPRPFRALTQGVQPSLLYTSSLFSRYTYSFLDRIVFTPSRIFSAIMVFRMMEDQIFNIMYTIPELLRAKVSYDRYGNFLNSTELLSEGSTLSKTSEDVDPVVVTEHPREYSICFNALTLNVALAAPVAAHVVVLGRNGNVTAQGPVSEVLQKDTQLHALVEKEQDGVEEDKYDENINGRDDTDVEEAKKVIGKLIVAEEKTVGRVEMAAIMLSVGGIGGPLIWALYLGIKSLYLGIKWAGMLVMIFQTWCTHDINTIDDSLGRMIGAFVSITINVICLFSAAVLMHDLWIVDRVNPAKPGPIWPPILELALEFMCIDHEPKPSESGKPPAYWPSSGEVRFEKLFFYLVGRTGAGKSSIALALLRAIKTAGKVYYDGLATDEMNLDALLSNITLTPQQPGLIHGTLRENLDPFGQHDDASLNDAKHAGQWEAENDTPTTGAEENAGDTQAKTRIGLDTMIESGGANFSLGQRQIIALARAIVRRSKLHILDEATAAIGESSADYDTDSAIQKTLRTEFSRDTTLITIAHRL